APNKRIGFFLGQAAAPDFNTPPDFANLTDDGKKLLLSTLTYAFPITTTPAGINVNSVKIDGANLTLTWTGGTPPFKVQRRDDVGSGAWTDISTNTEHTATVPRTGELGFLRVAGQ